MTLPPSSAKTLLKTVSSKEASQPQDAEDQIPPLDTADDKIQSSKKHDEEWTLCKKQGAQNNNEEVIPSSDKEGKDQIPTNTKKARVERAPSQESYEEVCEFDYTNKTTFLINASTM